MTETYEEEKENSQNDGPQVNEKANEYLRDCLAEKSRLEKKFPIAERLLDEEIEKVQSTGRIPTRDRKYVHLYREKPIRVAQKILVPVREHPKFNFVGKLLGPKGNSLRRLQEDTLCKMTVLGRNSMKDRAKEEELRASMDPKYAHLNDDLHVEISTIAPPAEAHARIAYAMAELRKYLIPDSNDGIRQEQFRELQLENPDLELKPGPPGKKPPPGGPPRPSTYHHGGYRAPPPNHASPSGPRTAVPPKQKVLSILERARSAMDESYRHYEEPAQYEPPPYDNYSYGHAPPSSRATYESQEYEPEYRRGGAEYYPPSPNYPVKGSTSTRSPPWKTTPGSASSHPYTPSGRRHDDSMSGMSAAKHNPHIAREARYKSAPYQKAK